MFGILKHSTPSVDSGNNTEVGTTSELEELRSQLVEIDERKSSLTAKNPLYAQYLDKKRESLEQQITSISEYTEIALDELKISIG